MSRLVRTSRSALMCRVLLVLLPLAAVTAAWQRPGLAFLVLLVMMTGLWAARPESAAGIVVILLVVAWWGISVDDPLGPRLLIAAATLLAAHVSAILASYGPARMPIDGPLAVLWLLRGLVSFAVAPLAWVVSTNIDALPRQPALWSIALLSVTGAVLAAAVVLRETSSDQTAISGGRRR